MKRIQYFNYGGLEELRLDEVPLPVPEKGQLLVRVSAASLNPMDGKIRRGELKPLTGSRFPRGLGHDFAGVVEAVGTEVVKFKVGMKSLAPPLCVKPGHLPNTPLPTNNKLVKNRHPFRSRTWQH